MGYFYNQGNLMRSILNGLSFVNFYTWQNQRIAIFRLQWDFTSIQECIPVGCVLAAAVTISPAMHTPRHACPHPPHMPPAMHTPAMHALPPTMHAPLWTDRHL